MVRSWHQLWSAPSLETILVKFYPNKISLFKCQLHEMLSPFSIVVELFTTSSFVFSCIFCLYAAGLNASVLFLSYRSNGSMYIKASGLKPYTTKDLKWTHMSSRIYCPLKANTTWGGISPSSSFREWLLTSLRVYYSPHLFVHRFVGGRW